MTGRLSTTARAADRARRQWAAAAAVALTLLAPVTTRADAPPVKTLDDIRIEGEIRLPRVLFITSRDTDRPLDFLEHYRVLDAESPSVEEPVPVIGPEPTGVADRPAASPPQAIDTTEEVDR